MALWFNLREDSGDLAIAADQERGALDPHVLPAVHALFFPDAVGFGDRVIRIRNEGIAEPVLCGKLRCASGSSGETPTISALSFENLADASRNSQASLVQPGVSDFGKKKTTTLLPRSFES